MKHMKGVRPRASKDGAHFKRKKGSWLALPCAAVLLAAGSAMTAQAATGWTMEGEEWVYYNGDGSKATDVFKKSGNNWYYLGSDGSMIYSSIVESGDDYYYVNSAGAMVTNEWRAVENENSGNGDEPDEWWYYLQANGKAVRRSGSSDQVKFHTLNTSTGPAKFTFDEEGHMLFGWIDESGEMLTDDDAWKNGLYYCNDNGNGRMTTGWKYMEAVNDEDKSRDGDGYWFWFGSNGKKISNDTSKTINGRKYRFDENGAAYFEWYNNPASVSSASSSSALKYYNTEEQCWLSTGWFKAVPDENIDPEGYDDGEEVWYYAQSNGDLVKSQIKRINGQSYGFDEFGKMLHGLYAITYDTDGRTILTAEEIENEDQLPDENDTNTFIYYFGNSPKEGAMKTGTITLEIDGDKYYYSFQKSGSKKGSGTEGISDDCIYIEGRRLEAEAGSKYQVVSYDGKDYLIGTNGKLAKSKKNIKDADDVYYKTDKNGVVIDSGDEKLD